MTKLYLLIAGIAFLAFGLWALIAPGSMASVIEFTFETLAARTEMRAFYGGLEIGFGLFLIMGGLNAHLRKPALLAAMIIVGSIASSRLIGMLVDQTFASNFHLMALGVEVITVLIAWICWRRET